MNKILTATIIGTLTVSSSLAPFSSADENNQSDEPQDNSVASSSTSTDSTDKTNDTTTANNSVLSKSNVGYILIEGNKSIKKEDIQKLITHTKIGDAYNKENVKLDLEDISKSGIVQNVKGRTVQNNGKLYVVFDVTELANIKSITVKGNTLVSTDDITSNLVSKINEQFSKKNIDTDIEKIKELYKDKGYMAIVSDVNNNNGDVTITISEAKVQKINYYGNTKTKSWVLDKIVNKHIKTGEFLKVKDLQNVYNDLTDTGFFKTIKIDADNGDGLGNVILKISVDESKTGEWNLGGGYSDQYKAELVGGIRSKNIKGEAKSINLDMSLGSGKQTFDLSYVDPYWKKSDTSVYADVFKTQKDINSTYAEYTENHTGGKIGFMKPISDDKKTKLFSDFTVDNITTDYKSGAKVDGVKDNYVTLGINRDTRNDTNGSGTVMEASIAESQKSFGSDNDFTKVMVGLKNYAKISAKNVLASRVQLNWSPDTLSPVEQFSIGGSDSVRGLDEDAQRGNKSLLASLELRHNISDTVQGVVFVDAGKAWNDEINNALKASTGLGLRIKTAMGILRLDAAKSGGDSIKYMFGIGQSF